MEEHSVRDAALQKQLQSRREKLKTVMSGMPGTEHLQYLLNEVDAALERMNNGTFDICEICHTEIENDLLLVNPLSRYCLGDLSEAEQRALERDLGLASQIQSGLLPRPGLPVEGWDVSYHYEPAGPVSGDYCDLIVLEDGSALFVFGDVSGKGVAASMLMAQLHAIFRSLITTTRSLTELVSRANRVFCEGISSPHFATLVCGWLGSDGGVEVCNAGHPYPLHLHDRDVYSIESTDLPLGLFFEGQYSSRKIKLEKGDTLVLYTDGLSESFNNLGQPYGTQRLSDLLRQSHSYAPKELLTASLEDLKQFRSGAPATDDLTIMVIRRKS